MDGYHTAEATDRLRNVPPRSTIMNVARIVVAALSLGGMFVQATHLERLQRFALGSFLSFFTIQSNLLAIAVLAIESGGGFGLSPRRRDALRGATVLYLAITGIVYATLLSGLPAAKQMIHPFADRVHHVLLPLWMAFDWIALPPGKTIPYRRALLWLGYPLAYLGFTLARGVLTGWFPYPFLNPHGRGGWGAVAGTSVGITLMACGLIWLILFIAGKRAAGGRGVGRQPAAAE